MKQLLCLAKLNHPSHLEYEDFEYEGLEKEKKGKVVASGGISCRHHLRKACPSSSWPRRFRPAM